MAWVEELASGSFRGGYRVKGRKFQATFTSKLEAWTWAENEEARAQGTREAIEGPTWPELGPTVSDVAQRWIAARWVEVRGQSLSKRTAEWYQAHARTIGASSLGRLPVSEVTAADVATWKGDLFDHGSQTGKPLGLSSVSGIVKTLGMILRDAQSQGLTTRDATYGQAVQLPDAEDRSVSKADLDKLLAVAEPKIKAQLLLATLAGLRWQEVFGLKSGAIQLDGSPVLIVQEVATRDRTTRVGSKSGRTRRVPMLPELVEAVRPFVSDDPDALLFPGSTGKARDYHGWRRQEWVPLLAAADVKGVSFHGLRHTYGTALGAASVPRSKIAQLMGHADEKTTARYIHAGETERDAADVAAAMAKFNGR